MEKILMTGHLGGVGSVLYKLFKDSGADIAPLDLNQDVSAKRILHLAAKSPPATDSEMHESNIAFLKKVINFAEKNKIKELIFFSAASVYGDIDKENVCEDDIGLTPCLYGALKLLGEDMLESSELDCLCLRFPAILSFKNETNLLSRSFLKLLKEEHVEIFNSDRIFNNFISIEDIFRFVSNLYLKEKFDVINLASNKDKTLKEVIEIVKDKLNSPSKLLIEERHRNFFNLSIKKAQKKYNFFPNNSEEVLRTWVRQRIEYEKA